MEKITFTITIEGNVDVEALREYSCDDPEMPIKDNLREYIRATLASEMQYDKIGTTCTVE